MRKNNVIVQGRIVNHPYQNFADDVVTQNQMEQQYPEIQHSNPNYQQKQVQMRNIPTGNPLNQNYPQQHLHHHIPPPQHHIPNYHHMQYPMQQPLPQQPMTTLNYANGCQKQTIIVCHNCQTLVKTMLTQKPGKITFVWAAILGFTCGLCCIPFFCNKCLDKQHYCPKCGIQCGKKEATFM